jgi:hypothetical protein
VRHVAAGAWQTDVARAQGLSPGLLGRWQRPALAKTVPSSAECEEVKHLRAELKRIEQAHRAGVRHVKKSYDRLCAAASIMNPYQLI